ncbi:Cell division protein SepF [Lentibacillus sp. JNUCC-1]|uniref:cell division protein SepF n=1 Tax=Lentibacillus sp. JNUCC-1 TaxID=2654513 RepID=UPI0012E7BA6F|nr:cell division protein SepF [Lentibacillus sp. JNUCC-1]MUV36208.1 Cell division protein SepF [Lentibacillus sp. JNUCC-1]
MGFKNKFKDLFTLDDEYEYVESDERVPEYDSQEGSNKGNVVNLKSMQQPSSKVVLCEPRTYNEVQEIADHVVNRRAVVVNLQRVDQKEGRRIVDFLSGTVYALEGEMQKLGRETFLCTPDNITVSGAISESIAENDDFIKGWS